LTATFGVLSLSRLKWNDEASEPSVNNNGFQALPSP
jgi:hypothetical protein